MTNDVTFTRADYAHALPDWHLVSDVCDGERQVKSKKEAYLPRLNPTDKSQENQVRYDQYLLRAVFYNATGRTLQGLVGAAFRKWPSLVVPTALDYVSDDADGHGVSVYQQSQKVVAELFKKGRHALYVDYPAINGSLTKEQQAKQQIQASILSIDAVQVINWRTEHIGGVHRLALVVICEDAEQTTEDGFGSTCIKQYRVLRLVEGVYNVEIWQEIKDKAGLSFWVIVEQHTPLDGTGKTWDLIPFAFVGAVNNDACIDRSPLLDLATLNIAHYRNSADYEDSAFFVGQAQPYMTGLTEEWRDHLEKSKIVVGSRTILPLPEGGNFGYAQVNPNTLVKEAMDTKEEQMKALGARLVKKGEAIKTATEAQGDSESEHSVLSLIASNVSEVYTLVLGWVARFMNAPENDIAYTINQDFSEYNLDPQMLTALVGAWQAGRLPSSDFWTQMRKYGLVDSEKTDEEINDELDSEPIGLGLDDAVASTA